MTSLPPEFRFECADGHLQLSREGKEKPLWLDFTQKSLSVAERRRKIARKDPLFRALGPVGSVWDLTAGLGQDAFLMALMGYTVTAVERSPVLIALIQDAVKRASEQADYKALFAERLRFVEADAREFLKSRPLPGAVYLDPMYPEKKKAALARKQMRWLKELVGEDDSGAYLLDESLALGVPRVVVKRPIKGALLREGPSQQFKGQTTRYDLYVGRVASKRN